MTATATSLAAPAAASTATGLVPQSALRLRPAEARGRADFGWLDSKHSFSFGQYFDPAHMGFSNLRVINDDRVAGGGGFPMHPHRDAEIFSYVLDGGLAHQDSLGNGSTVMAGGVQYMSAGSGVTHSEFNPSQTEPMHFLQVWLLPDVEGAEPRYDTLDIAPADKDGRLALFLSPGGRDGSMRINADADIYAATLDGDQRIGFEVREGRSAWIQIARGNAVVNGTELREGDGLAAVQSGRLELTGEGAELLLFDLPA